MFRSPFCALVVLSACAGDPDRLEGLHPDFLCLDEPDSGTIPDDSGTIPDDSRTTVDSPAPLSRDTTEYGGYANLDVAWFQWILSQPRIGNPGFDPTGDACATGQSGDVWFLAGSFNESVAERTCRIPPGKALFVPVLNEYTHCWFWDDSCTEQFLITELDSKLDGVRGMYATIDGHDMGHAADYRVSATEFSVTLPEGNLFQSYGIPFTGLVEDLYGGGYWMLFEPLEPGEHTITFGGVFPGEGASDTTYTLTVEE